MKRVWQIWLLAGFAAVSILGTAVIAVELENSHQSCLAAAAQGGALCPESVNPLVSLNFHANALKTLAAFHSAGAESIILLITLGWVAGLAFWRLPLPAAPPLALARRPADPSLLTPTIASVRRWHALHENSPNLL